MESACSSFQQLLEQSPEGAGGFGWQAARKFEYDPRKPNKKKHGIDFEEAQTLWKDEDRLQIQVRSDTEPPF